VKRWAWIISLVTRNVIFQCTIFNLELRTLVAEKLRKRESNFRSEDSKFLLIDYGEKGYVVCDTRRMVTLHAAGIHLNENMFKIKHPDEIYKESHSGGKITYDSALQKTFKTQNKERYNKMLSRSHPRSSPKDIDINVDH